MNYRHSISTTLANHSQLNWNAPSAYSVQQLPEAIRTWLLDASSMTKRLMSLSNNQIQLKVLKQTWQCITLEEAERLLLTPHAKALVREVLFINQQDIWLYARTVLPTATVAGKHRFLRRLGSRPIGHILFGEQPWQRSDFELAHGLVENEQQNVVDNMAQAEFWGRRSLFSHGRKKILLTEIILPQLLEKLPR